MMPKSSQNSPPTFSLFGENFAICATINILTKVQIAGLWGFNKKSAELILPIIPEAAIENDFTNQVEKTTFSFKTIKLDFLETTQGKAFFAAYLQSLKPFLLQHKIAQSTLLTHFLTNWRHHFYIKDASVAAGFRYFYCYDNDTQAQKNTLQALKKTLSGKQLLILNNEIEEADDADEDEGEEQKYMDICEYFAVDATSVYIKYVEDNAENEAFIDKSACKMCEATLDKPTFVNAFTQSLNITQFSKKIAATIHF